MYDIAPPGPPGCRRMTHVTRHDPAAGRRDAPKRSLRVALYSHDTMGLGHLRRNLLIADAMAQAPLEASSLLITGAHEANFFRLPPRADLLTLPRWRKSSGGGYSSAQLSLSRSDLTRLRAESVRSALEVFNPDLLIVDKVPVGAFGELLPSLRRLAESGKTRIVLGVRDVLDEPSNVAREWLCAENVDAMTRFYDSIWVYGDRRVYDPVREYGLPIEVAAKVTFTGYIDQTARIDKGAQKTVRLLETLPKDQPLVLCTVGGGQDGAELAAKFIRAFPAKGRVGVVVGGPFMPDSALNALREEAAEKGCVHVFDFLPEADLLVERAERVVSMAGYNTVCSVLSFGKPALFAPRVQPRREQWIRAARLAELGVATAIHPDHLSMQRLRQWIESDSPARPAAPGVIDLDGLASISLLTQSLTTATQSRAVRDSLSLMTPREQ